MNANKNLQAKDVLNRICDLFTKASLDPEENWLTESQTSTLQIMTDEDCVVVYHQSSECCIGVTNTDDKQVEINVSAKNNLMKTAVDFTFLIGGHKVQITEFTFRGNKYHASQEVSADTIRFLLEIDYALTQLPIEQILYRYVSEFFDNLET